MAVTITGDFNRHFTKIASQCLTALAIVGITAGIDDKLMLAVAEMLGHFSYQRPLDQRSG
ncbi:hypothetical protein A1356_04110 [Methylomonas koyamae]|uniref:Uncharacterized protein n=1 Tax=Methylomonas koyamae TaxID=702114 RepID=A0AA91DGG4_9GAMM|nr:hypothetical protein A1356_04110 [Methylomonas koyamae]